MSGRAAGWRWGAGAGLVGGLAALGLMELANAVAGVRTLPQLLQGAVLAAVPGPVFGFLIDALQHAGKVLEEVGLLAVMLVVLVTLGAVAGGLTVRRHLGHAGLWAGAVAWLAVCLVALPLGGQGLFGMAGGSPLPALAWAVVFAVYGGAWQVAWPAPPEPTAGEPESPSRRSFLRAVPLGIGAAGLAVLAATRVPAWISQALTPAGSGLVGPVPDITPVSQFYLVSKNFQDPVVSERGWSLRVTGMVEQPIALGYHTLRTLPGTVSEYVTLECISNDVGGNLISTGRFTGVPLRNLLRMAQPRPGAAALNFTAADGYTESLPLATVMNDPSILVAHQLDGRPLPDEHGFPARILVPGHYGMKGPKWLQQIEVASAQATGFWEEQGWDQQAVVKTMSRIDSPRDGALLRLGPIPLDGIAFAGTRGITEVQVSANGGRSWFGAQLRPPLSPLTWVLWHAVWRPAREGTYTLMVRARDGQGQLQTPRQSSTFSSGSTGYDAVQVVVVG
jgi:DMSO/TMAO reductase YedYZ molybdopterin-dependent catalytic subunit